jgi:hypothetical protein
MSIIQIAKREGKTRVSNGAGYIAALTLAEIRNQAEAAGSAIAHDMNNVVLNSADQAEACRAIMAALNECFNPGNDPIVDSAAGGFSVAIVNVMERGFQAIRADRGHP